MKKKVKIQRMKDIMIVMMMMLMTIDMYIYVGVVITLHHNMDAMKRRRHLEVACDALTESRLRRAREVVCSSRYD